MSYLEELNIAQKKAVQHINGPLLILAGAGAGKTRVITYRIAHLIKNGVSPHEILAVTFTNKAAKEMRDRINDILLNKVDFNLPVSVSSRPFVRTFHSLGVHIIKENSEILNLPKFFSIFDSGDSKKIIRDSMVENGFDPKEHDPRKIQSIISNQKNQLISISDYETSDSKNSYLGKIISRVWADYEKKLQSEKALDFDDLLIKTVELLQKNPDILNKYQKIWKYIHIDEYQDTNKVQYLISNLLSNKHQNICVVGDIDQNIYSWRGATIKNILNFEKDYPNATEIILEENYRSTQNILQAANEVIIKNKDRKEKNLFTKNGEGDKIIIYQAIDEYDEANFIVQEAKKLITVGSQPDEIAFLYRTNFQSRVLEEICLQENLQHQVIGTRFFERREVKDILSYIKAAINQEDLTNLGRIINIPKRGIGKTTLLKILSKQEDSLNSSTKQKVNNFRSFLSQINAEIKTKKPHEVIIFISQKSGLEESLKSEGDDGLERLANIQELASLAKKYEVFEPEEAMEKMLEDVSLSTDQDEMEKTNGGVKLMTVHAAKGLEFENVFVTGLEAGLFPQNKFIDSKKDNEEERRLFYVAITRARKKLYLTYSSFRTIYGSKEINMPSEFLNDISDDILEYKSFEENYENDSENNQPRREYLIDF